MSALKPLRTPDVPAGEIVRLHGAGLSLVPLGGGADGKSPLCGFKGADRLPPKRLLGPMHSNGSACYGVRLGGLAVIDCDENNPDLNKQMEARFGVSPVHVATPRGMHLYYRFGSGQLPNLRGEGLPVDIKRGPSSYVVGPHSERPDGGVYLPVKGVLGVDELPLIKSQPASVKSGAIQTGNRNRELSLAAISMVEAVETTEELFGNLAFIRDDECEDPATVPDDELRKIAEWAWTKRLEGNVYRDRNSEFRLHRLALDALKGKSNTSDAIALYVTLQAIHGHHPGKTFKLNWEAMSSTEHTDLSRRRFRDARRTLEEIGLLAVANLHAARKHARSYRLCRVRQGAENVKPLFGSNIAKGTGGGV